MSSWAPLPTIAATEAAVAGPAVPGDLIAAHIDGLPSLAIAIAET
jgi:hypothetical protein